MIRTCMAFLLGAVDLALLWLAWISIEQHQILGLSSDFDTCFRNLLCN